MQPASVLNTGRWDGQHCLCIEVDILALVDVDNVANRQQVLDLRDVFAGFQERFRVDFLHLFLFGGNVEHICRQNTAARKLVRTKERGSLT